MLKLNKVDFRVKMLLIIIWIYLTKHTKNFKHNDSLSQVESLEKDNFLVWENETWKEARNSYQDHKKIEINQNFWQILHRSRSSSIKKVKVKEESLKEYRNSTNPLKRKAASTDKQTTEIWINQYLNESSQQVNRITWRKVHNDW